MIARERLESKLRSVGECLEFTGYRNPGGYGLIRTGATTHRAAHRIAWELANGPIPDGLVVMHACDNPPCCRVDHLSLGTTGDNNADRHAKGRTVVPGDPGAHQRNKTHCPQRHEFAEANTYQTPDGKRSCRTCRRAASARYREARSA